MPVMREVMVKLRQRSSQKASAVIRIQAQPLPEEDIFDVVVAEVKDPGHLYIQLGSQYEKLGKMMDELDDHYEPLVAKFFKEGQPLVPREFSVGDQVAAVWPTDNLWYRGVVKARKAGKWEVFYMDYGDTKYVEEPYIMPLDRNFCVLPAQAIRAHLAGIEPRCDEAANCKWPQTATRRVIQLTDGSHLSSLQLIVMDRQRESLAIVLLDHDDQGINEVLVNEDFAQLDETDETPFGTAAEDKRNNEREGEDDDEEEERILDKLHEEILKVDKDTAAVDIQVLFDRSVSWSNKYNE